MSVVSRARNDAQIYTNDVQKLAEELSREVSKQSALETEHEIKGHHQAHAVHNSENQSLSELHGQGEAYGVQH